MKQVFTIPTDNGTRQIISGEVIGHTIAEKDRERIKCPGDHQGPCDKPADICEYVGGGFYYHCRDHSSIRL